MPALFTSEELAAVVGDTHLTPHEWGFQVQYTAERGTPAWQEEMTTYLAMLAVRHAERAGWVYLPPRCHRYTHTDGHVTLTISLDGGSGLSLAHRTRVQDFLDACAHRALGGTVVPLQDAHVWEGEPAHAG